MDPSVADRVGTVNFYSPEFNAWVQKRGLADPENFPLEIRLQNRSPLDSDESGPITNASFQEATDQSVINLYVGHRLKYFDRMSSEYDATTREQTFNKALNSALAHELEHYIEVANGSLMQGFKLEYILQGLIDFSLHSYDKTPKTDEQLRAEIASLTKSYNSKNTYDLYLAQPHEIRAREASMLYSANNNSMLYITLNP